MKKTIITLLVLCSAATAHAKELKIGVFDYQKVIAESTATSKMQKELENMFSPRQRELIDSQANFESKVNELRRNESVMKPEQVEKTKNDLVVMKRDLERKGQDLQSDLQAAQAKIGKKLSEKMDKAIDTVGKNHKFDFILQKVAAPFAKAEYDVTAKITKLMK